MVRSILLFFTLFLMSGMAGLEAQTVLQGTVKDSETGETLIGATIKVMKGATIVRGGVTNYDGEYRFQMDAGTYDVEVSYTGYATDRTTGVQVLTGKLNSHEIKMASGALATSTEVVIKEFKVPLISKDQTSTGQTLTSETIKNLPTRSVNAIVATTAGTTSIDGGGVNIKGSRDNATNYYVDGIRVSGSTVPVQDIEQLSVVTGGLGAEYGDVTGGVISIVTKGPASDFSGAAEVETSYGLDPYGWLLATGNISGPLVKRRSDKSTIVGFRLSGQLWRQKDDDPPAFKVARAKQSVLDELYEHPMVKIGGNPFNAAESLTKDDVEYLSYRPNENRQDVDVTSKLDFRLNSSMDISLTGTYKNIQNKETPGDFGAERNWLLLNSQNNPTNWDQRYRGIFRFRHRLGSDGSSKDAAASRRVSISNASYQIQVGFERANGRREDPRHKERLFDYGHVGKYDFKYTPIGGFVIDTNGVRVQQVDTREDFYNFTPGAENPGLANYNEFFIKDAYETQDYDNFIVKNGLIGGTTSDIWSDMHTNISMISGTFRRTEDDILTINATSGFDLKLGSTGTHNIQFGLLNEQRTSRYYNVQPFSLWDLAYKKSNSHINGLDTTMRLGKFWAPGISEFIGDSLWYFANDTVELTDQKFYWKVRQAAGVGIRDYISLHSLNPDQLSLDQFGALELTNQENLINYYGYDYLGKKLASGITFNDFFTAKDADGVRTFPVAPLQPLYQAAYIRDKFQFKDAIISLGLRVERFDLNTKVMKDQYSLYNIMDAGEYYRSVFGGQKPANVGDDFKVYVQSSSDLSPKAFRDGETWYSADGTQQNDANLIFGQSPVEPLLKDTISGDEILDRRFDPNSSFKDYEPQVNWMPRIALSFPISDNANFFAHYDVLVQRPPGNWQVTPLDYLYFTTTSRTPENNANLKPERVVDYEVGFQQKLNNFSALKFSAYYKELRDMIQLRTILYVPTLGRYTSFDNIDFGTVKGFTLGYDLRRIMNTEIRLAYTLQFADGTGSNSESQRGLTKFGNLRTLYPLDYDERHNISAIIDYRFSGDHKKYNGPRVNGKDILANFGVNMQITGASGRPYTAKDAPRRFSATGTAGALNGSRLPWRTNLDLRVDKSFSLAPASSKFGLNLNIYLRVSNLLDARNIVGVYGFTGSPTDDGYLATTEGQSIVAGTGARSEAYLASYSWAMLNPNRFTQPRRMYMGATLEF